MSHEGYVTTLEASRFDDRTAGRPSVGQGPLTSIDQALTAD
jgi:hypothetical protein